MDKFYDAENELDLQYDNDIHIHKQMRGRKCTTIIQGLEFSSKEDNKAFITKIKKKFGINGCQKIVDDIDETNLVFIFTGDCREKIKDLLVLEHDKSEESIKIHG